MAKPSYSIAQIVGRITDFYWDEQDITYSIPMQANADDDRSEMPGFTAMTAKQIAMAREAFELWDDLIAVNLNETPGWDARMTFAYSSSTDDDGTYTDTSSDQQSQVWMSSDWDSNKDQNLYYSTYGFESYIHEIGHALGLDHPGPYNAGDADLTFDKKALYNQDTQQYTLMSYFEAGENGNGTDHVITVGTQNYRVYAATPLLHDIAAIQWTYGADLKTRTNDTVYGFNNTSGRDAFDFSKNWTPVVAIYDAGGTDTLDLSLYGTRQVVDLRPGTFSSIGDKGMTNNLAMSYAVDSYGRIEGLHANFNPYGIINYIENAKGGYGNDEITGNNAKNEIHGNDGNDKLYGVDGDDWLLGGNGNDELLGGRGNDFMQGGAGNDVYYVEEQYDAVSEFQPYSIQDAGGIDEVRTWRTTETLGSYVENLTYLGAQLTSQNFTGTGNNLNNIIKGAFGNDTLSGLGGNDTLEGGAGNDSLDGGIGADILSGGAGNEVYYVDNAGDQVIEFTRSGRFTYTDHGGIDEVKTSLGEYTLGRYVENLTYTGSGAFHGIGNGLNNVLRGGAGNDTLEGGLGNDTFFGGRGTNRLVGGAGNDTYHVGPVLYYGRDTIVEDADGGIDTAVYHAISSYLSFGHTLAENVENLTITGTYNARGTGNALDNVLIGNAGENTLSGLDGNDTLDGGDGFDTLIGGAGNDTYRVSSTIYQKPDTIVEEANGGIDTVIYTSLSSLASMMPSYTLGAELENLTIGGALDADGTGNGADNILIGNAASNTLKGLGGNDTLDGGLGFDTLEGGEGNDTLLGTYQYSVYGVELMDGGTGNDTADFSKPGHALWIDLDYPGREVWTRDRADVDTGTWRQVADLVSVENLIGTAGNDQMWGNAEANIIYGHAGDDFIDGRDGNDILSGGFANEPDSRGNDGNDRIFGGKGDDLITVSYGADIVDGGEDTDTLSFAWVGGDLNVDLSLLTTTFREGGGYVTEFGGGGWSTLVTVTWSSIENLTGGLGNDILAGGVGTNRIEGGDGNDTINGGAGNDILAGGAGADTHAFANTWGHDTVTDFADGVDRLDLRQVSGLWSIDQLQIEDTANGAKITFAGNTILLTGIAAGALTDADFLFAPAPLENLVITGTEGNDVLVGGFGADTISGRGGYDILKNIDSGDTVDGGEGYDYVYAGAHTDAAGFKFTVAGTNVDYVNGSEGDDVIDSSGVTEGYTQMHGDAGNDLFKTGDGIEWMFGGMGHDTAVFNGNRADYTIVEDQWEWTGWTGITNNTTGVLDWIISVETLQFADVTIAAPGVRPEIAGTAGNDTLAGGDDREELFGAAGDDELGGGGGDDIMVGGAGADRFIGGAGSDVFYIDNDDTLIDGGAGFDYVFADDSQGPIGLRMDFAGTSIENIWGGMGNDVIDVSRVVPDEFPFFAVNVNLEEGDDTVIGSAYVDYIVGGAGNDTMVFAGNRADYTIEADARWSPGRMKVTETATGVSDWLYDMETVKFADGSWPLQ